MEPLDLRTAPPRRPRAELAGIVFLPRSIDKVRGTLPGGHLGAYSIPGITTMMLETFDVPLADFTETVRSAASDEDVAAFMTARVSPALIEEWNAKAKTREPAGGDRAVALERYPWLPERPDLTAVVDVLEEDDRRSFLGNA
jgi:hypothetical protein